MATTCNYPSRTLDLTILSADDLRMDRKSTTKNLYVVVRANCRNYTTGLAAAEGDNPLWNQKLFIDVPLHARSITFEVKCKTSTTGVKDVGVVRIAASDLIGGVVPENCLQFLSYRLRDWEGRRNGVINFSVKAVKSTECVPLKTASSEKAGPCGFQMRGPVGMKRSSGGIATGVPVVSWNNYAKNV